ncbi:BMC domain-containing protein [Desulforamulus hydrothermalis]|uniref:Microcompartments protein n=1 Tax=Desulforamulus hydrothermalis Lam5 = DSM 18033 TaxID=1121428 RepID=K8E895_9FIRM|nr:BMC domain-containing protein [Desulforamulus hydrothermalis]CCO07723.1 Microcompartments protein [Desulforamulus hydrothermalis Lam5 = DSM 18033]SHH33802.1 BMC domain-containing protein [Desulforamulus hydrothermalis Lam5 = DSM 18033]
MEYRIIKSPSKGALDIILRRKSSALEINVENCDAVGLVQGRLIDMVCAADIAEKAAGVVVADIRGQCPQHLIMIAVFGDTAAVETAIQEIKYKLNDEKVKPYARSQSN